MKLKCIFAVFLTLIYYHYSFKIHKDTGKYFFIYIELLVSSACSIILYISFSYYTYNHFYKLCILNSSTY